MVNGAAPEDITIKDQHIMLACEMCEAMGMDMNARVVEGDDTRNWQFLLPAAARAWQILRPPAPEGDLWSLPAPDGNGWLMRIDHQGQLYIRDDIKPGVPLFTIVNKAGDVTVGLGPLELKDKTDDTQD